MSFNFGNLANAKPVSSTNYLKAYTIYDNVSIKRTDIKTGNKSDGGTWKQLVITFGNDEGIYNHTIFYPNEQNPRDITRQEYDSSNGGKRVAPSAIEELQNQIASIGFEFFPDDFAKLQTAAAKITTVEQLMTFFKQFIDKNIDKVKTRMKLVGRNNEGHIYATLPKFTGIACADTEKKASANGVSVGEWYTWRVSPFGAKVAFSAYEQGQANSYHSAKPTPIGDPKVQTDPINDFETPSTDNLNFDELISGLE